MVPMRLQTKYKNPIIQTMMQSCFRKYYLFMYKLAKLVTIGKTW